MARGTQRSPSDRAEARGPGAIHGQMDGFPGLASLRGLAGRRRVQITQSLLAGALLLTAAGALAQASNPQQTATYGVNNNGDFNSIINIIQQQQMDPEQVAAIVLRGLNEKADRKDDADRKRLRAELAKAKRASREDRETLRRLTEELLSRDRELRELTQANLQLRLELQAQISKLPEGQAKEDTQSALDDADFKRVEDMLERERMDTQEYTQIGPVVTMASDRTGGIGGLAAGVYFDGLHVPGFGGKTVGFLPLTGSGEMMIGSVRLEDRSSFLLSLASLVGPRLRLGSPHGLLLGFYYYFPFLMVTRGHLRFPLIGIGASLGFQVDQTHVSIIYRYSMTRILYSDEPNVHFFGLAVALPMKERLR